MSSPKGFKSFGVRDGSRRRSTILSVTAHSFVDSATRFGALFGEQLFISKWPTYIDEGAGGHNCIERNPVENRSFSPVESRIMEVRAQISRRNALCETLAAAFNGLSSTLNPAALRTLACSVSLKLESRWEKSRTYGCFEFVLL